MFIKDRFAPCNGGFEWLLNILKYKTLTSGTSFCAFEVSMSHLFKIVAHPSSTIVKLWQVAFLNKVKNEQDMGSRVLIKQDSSGFFSELDLSL